MDPQDTSKDNNTDSQQPDGLAPETIIAPTVGSYNAFSDVTNTPPETANTPEVDPPQDSNVAPIDSPSPLNAGTTNSTAGTTTEEQPEPVPALTTPTPPPAKKSRKKLFIIAGASSLALILLVSGFVFGYYIPNQPSNVYKTGMNRSGQAIDKLVERTTSEKQLKTFDKTEAKANLNVELGASKFSGKIESKFSASKIDGALTITSEPENEEKQEASLKILSNLAKDHQFPDIYLQVTGLHTFGYDQMIPQLAQYDGKWISFNEDFIKTLGIDKGAFNGDKQINQADAVELAKVMSSAMNKYVLNGDTSKSVLENRKFIGKEKSDGVNAYHYKVGVNKANLKNACKPVYDSLINTSIYKKIASSTGDKDKASKAKADVEAVKNCEDNADKVDTSKTIDMWIDGKNKLVQKIRLHDDNDPSAYTDIGQNYQGGDKISFYAHYNSSKSKADVKMTFDSDMKTNISSGTIVASGGDSEKFKVNVDYTIKPYNGDIKVDKPEGSIPIKDVLSSLGLSTDGIGATSSTDTSTSSSSVQSGAKDTERKADISAIMSNNEAYWAQNGFYPSLAQLNDKSWRAAHFNEVDEAAFIDPSGSSNKLNAGPATAGHYGYEVSGCAGNNKDECSDFTLTAMLSDGTLLTKKSLNSL